MSLYRRTHVKMWASADFRSLSRPQPNAQSLFQYLITGDHTSVIPGVVCIGRAAIGEALGWTADDVTERFAELSERGMAVADWDARLVYLPAALAHNMPSNPNQVLAWRNTWALVPACLLRDRIEADMVARLPKLAEPLARALNRSPDDSVDGSANGSGNRSPNGSGNGLPNRFANGLGNGCCETCNLPKVPFSAGSNGFGNGSGNGSSRTCACAPAAPAPDPGIESQTRDPIGMSEIRTLWFQTREAVTMQAFQGHLSQTEEANLAALPKVRAGAPRPKDSFGEWLRIEFESWVEQETTRHGRDKARQLNRGWSPTQFGTWYEMNPPPAEAAPSRLVQAPQVPEAPPVAKEPATALLSDEERRARATALLANLDAMPPGTRARAQA